MKMTRSRSQARSYTIEWIEIRRNTVGTVQKLRTLNYRDIVIRI